jgi:hypothetical protein
MDSDHSFASGKVQHRQVNCHLPVDVHITYKYLCYWEK